jgi:uncharacterized protein (DUF849 family)
MTLPLIMVAPNGARLQKTDHPALPVTQDEIVTCAKACFAEGAAAIHTHIRDDGDLHLLDAAIYHNLVQALREAVPEMAIQITTESGGHYPPKHQMNVALAAGADLVSASIRELCRAEQNEVRAFFADCKDRGITLQHILYNTDDCALLETVLGADALRDPNLQLLFVLGRYGQQPARPDDLNTFLDWMATCKIAPDWAVCAFGKQEVECLLKAVKNGGNCRTGFENSLHLSDGTIAKDNAAKVADLKALL